MIIIIPSAQKGPEHLCIISKQVIIKTLSKSITYYLKQGATKSKLLLVFAMVWRKWKQ